ncbi:MAG: hypothetical protein HY903_15360 [Deltaproteobacteria bacterium]|nr:hypothetical protein [Deltaproteobacteria bacterium]
MILLDLALQGYRDLSGSIRVRLQSGYNALVTPGAAPETVVAGLLAVLFGRRDKSPLAGKKSGGGVSLMGADGLTLRAVRDFGAGTGQLFEFMRDTRAFSPLAADAAQIEAALRGRMHLPSREVFEAVYVVRAQDLPSAARAAAAKPESEDDGPPPDPEVLKAKLAELDRTLAELKRVEALEFELDGLQKQRFDLEDKMKALAFDDSELLAAQAELKRLAYLEALPPDFGARDDLYRKLVLRRDQDLKRWQAERTAMERAGVHTEVAPLAKDWRLWVGLAVGVVAVVVAGFQHGMLRYVALADIPAFGLATLVVFRHLSQREAQDRLRFRRKLSDERQTKIVARDAAEINAVEELLKTAGLTSGKEVQQALAMRAAVQARVQGLAAEAERARQNPEVAALKDERDRLMTAIAQIEETLAGLSALPVDRPHVQAEAEAMRQRLARLLPKVAAAPAEERAPLSAWFKAALELMMSDPDTTARILSERASLIIRALSANRVVAIVYDAGGDVVMRTAQGGAAKWATMPDSVRDLVYLALRGALILALDPKTRGPVLAYGLAAALPGGQEVESQFLSTMAQAGQLVHVVRRADEAPKAKHLATAEVSA